MYPTNYLNAAAEYENQRAIDCESHYRNVMVTCMRCEEEKDADFCQKTADDEWICFDCIDEIAEDEE